MTKLNGRGDIGHVCLEPLVLLNEVDREPNTLTLTEVKLDPNWIVLMW